MRKDGKTFLQTHFRLEKMAKHFCKLIFDEKKWQNTFANCRLLLSIAQKSQLKN